MMKKPTNAIEETNSNQDFIKKSNIHLTDNLDDSFGIYENNIDPFSIYFKDKTYNISSSLKKIEKKFTNQKQ